MVNRLSQLVRRKGVCSEKRRKINNGEFNHEHILEAEVSLFVVARHASFPLHLLAACSFSFSSLSLFDHCMHGQLPSYALTEW